MNKHKQNISLFILTSILLTIGTIPYFSQNAYAAVTSVTITGPDTSQSFGASFTMRYTIADDGANTATAGSITFTRTGGTADANSPHTYTMAAGDRTTGAKTITRATLEAGFGNSLVDGTIYTIVVSVTDGAAFTDTATSVTADFTAPTFTAAKTASNQITLTWSENVNSAADTATAGNPFTLGGTALTVSSTSALDGTGNTQILTLSGTIPDNDSITISYDKDASNGDIVDSVTSTNQPNEAPDINNVSLSGTTVQNGGGSGCDDCEAPTLGVDKRGAKLVSNGFTYNGHSVDVERFFTPYPLITANVGQTNKAEFKIYENEGNDNIKHFSFAFGLGKGQVISESKAMIELDIDHEGKETVTITDPENALENVKVETSVVHCDDDKRISCLSITIEHTFRAPLDFNIVATDVWDVKRNAWQNYYNHGIEVVGESLNPPKEYDGIYKGHIYHLTETSKTTAVDSFGDTWTFDKIWTRDFKNTIIVDPEWNVMTRYNSNFNNYVDAEAVKAIDTLMISCPTCLKSFDDFTPSKTITYSERINKLDNPEIQSKMLSESKRAQKTMANLLDPLLYRIQ